MDGWRALGVGPTISIGMAEHERHTDPNTTFEVADRALYLAKHSGRNQIARSQSLASVAPLHGQADPLREVA